MPDFYVQAGELQFGPLSASDLKKLAAAGRILPKHRVRKGETGKWYPAARVEGLVFGSDQTPPTKPSSKQSGGQIAADSVHAGSADIARWTATTLVPWLWAQGNAMSPKERSHAAVALTVIIGAFVVTVANLVSPEWMSSRPAHQAVIEAQAPIETQAATDTNQESFSVAANEAEPSPAAELPPAELPPTAPPLQTTEPSLGEELRSEIEPPANEEASATDVAPPTKRHQADDYRDLTIEKFQSLYVGESLPLCRAILGGLGTTIRERRSADRVRETVQWQDGSRIVTIIFQDEALVSKEQKGLSELDSPPSEPDDSPPPGRAATKKAKVPPQRRMATKKPQSPSRKEAMKSTHLSPRDWADSNDASSEDEPKTVTMEKYNACGIGTSKSRCEEILGVRSNIMSEMEYGQGTKYHTKRETVEWCDGRVTIGITFENDKVVSKIQFGL